MPLLFLILLLLAPLLDIYLVLRWLFDSPLTAGLYAATAALLGALLMKFAKIGVGEAARLLSAGRAPPAAVARFVKLWAAGALLFFPGYLSDALAAGVLLLPSPPPPPKTRFAARNDPPLEAEAEIVSEDERRD